MKILVCSLVEERSSHSWKLSPGSFRYWDKKPDHTTGGRERQARERERDRREKERGDVYLMITIML